MTAPPNKGPQVKGWCPGALRPMMSGDGLLVRVKPWMGRLSRDQVLGLCDIADQFGNGTIDVTSRANLQIRGVAHHGLVVAALRELDLVDQNLEIEAKRNITVSPDWIAGDETCKLYDAITDRISDWPDLPNKMGIAIDPKGWLHDVSADFRFERSIHGGLMLRADGADSGVVVTLETAADQLIDLMQWFVDTGGTEAGRMRRHLKHTCLPNSFQKMRPATVRKTRSPNWLGTKLGLMSVVFGQMQSNDLRVCFPCHPNGPLGLRTTPWGQIVFEEDYYFGYMNTDGFSVEPDDPLLLIKACPGAPGCSQAYGNTRDLAHKIAPHITGPTHISGCAKGCACPKDAPLTITATPDGYALARDAAPWDTADRTGLSAQDIIEDLNHAL
ncbi:MAG: hypothetical protein AAF386_01775 [Pseudomonadota bacterium]